MNKPRWQVERGDLCQWPRCNKEGGAHYALGATKWIDVDDGVWLCDGHLREMGEALWPELKLPFELHTLIHIAAFEDYPREAVYANDWYVNGEGIILLVGDTPETNPEDCQEVPLRLIETG